MKRVVLILAGAIASAGLAMAAEPDATTTASKDPSKIPGLVKEMGGQSVSQFAADVMSAIGTMPGSPSRKTRKMAEAATAFLGTVPDGELASLLASMTANVPFGSLPTWVKLFKSPVDDLIKELSDAAYNKLVNDVMSKINALADTSDADKTVISCFALKLLARGANEDENEAWLAKVALPAAYADQVKAAMPGVFAGNYDSVLGPETKVVKDLPPVLHPTNPEDELNTALQGKKPSNILPGEWAFLDRDAIDRPEPMVVPPPPPPPPAGPGKKKPPVTPVYAGQW